MSASDMSKMDFRPIQNEEDYGRNVLIEIENNNDKRRFIIINYCDSIEFQKLRGRILSSTSDDDYMLIDVPSYVTVHENGEDSYYGHSFKFLKRINDNKYMVLKYDAERLEHFRCLYDEGEASILDGHWYFGRRSAFFVMITYYIVHDDIGCYGIDLSEASGDEADLNINLGNSTVIPSIANAEDTSDLFGDGVDEDIDSDLF